MSTDYQNYVTQTLRLARSITIKSDVMALKINRYLEQLGHLTPSDEREWKYYLNLAGNYHFLDEEMVIISFDTLERIRFCKEELKKHPVTQEYYLLDSLYYRRLVERYPEQELLIRGILSPIDIEKVISAEDHTIIDYDENLVERNEENLIYELQRRIDWYYDRWNVSGYHEIDDLYTTAHLAILYSQLPMFLFNIRLANCHTYHVHSFHIKEYLKSHNRLDRYYDYLTLKQALFLYRNIPYIRNNAGRQETFDWLVEKLLTERSIGIAEYQILENTSDLIEDLRPKVELLRTSLNKYHKSTRKDEHTLKEVLIKQEKLTPNNIYVQEQTNRVDGARIVRSSRNQYPTKALESSMIDRSIGGYFPFSEYLLNHWLDRVTQGDYTGFTRVKNPATGDLVTLTHREVIILYCYTQNLALNQELTTIPTLRARLVRRKQNPTAEKLRSLGAGRVDDNFIQHLLTYPPFRESTASTLRFYQLVKDSFDDFEQQHELFTLEENATLRGYKEAIVYHLYQIKEIPLVSEPTRYEDWLYDRNLDFRDISKGDLETFSRNLLEESTGELLGGNLSLFDIQNAMIRLLSELSSYSVHFLREINPGPIHNWEWISPRTDVQISGAKLKEHIRVIPFNVTEIKNTGRQSLRVDPYMNNQYRREYKSRIKVTCTDNQRIIVGAKRVDKIRLPLPLTRFYIDKAAGEC